MDDVARFQREGDQHLSKGLTSKAKVAYSCGIERARLYKACPSGVLSKLYSSRAEAHALHRGADETNQALDDALKAVKINPANLKAIITGATCMFEKGMVDQAVEMVSAGVERIVADVSGCNLAQGKPTHTDLKSAEVFELLELKLECDSVRYVSQVLMAPSVQPDDMRSPFPLSEAFPPESLDALLTDIVICMIATAPMESGLLVGGVDGYYNQMLRKLLALDEGFVNSLPRRPFQSGCAMTVEGKSSRSERDTLCKRTFAILALSRDEFTSSVGDRGAREGVADAYLSETQFSLQGVSRNECHYPWQVLVIKSLQTAIGEQALEMMKLAVQLAPDVVCLKLQLARVMQTHGLNMKAICTRKRDSLAKRAEALFLESRSLYDEFLSQAVGGRYSTLIQRFPHAVDACLFATWEAYNIRDSLSSPGYNAYEGVTPAVQIAGSTSTHSEMTSSKSLGGHHSDAIKACRRALFFEKVCLIAEKSNLVGMEGFQVPQDDWIAIVREWPDCPQVLEDAQGNVVALVRRKVGWHAEAKTLVSSLSRSRDMVASRREFACNPHVMMATQLAKTARLEEEREQVSRQSASLQQERDALVAERATVQSQFQRISDLEKKEAALVQDRQNYQCEIARLTARESQLLQEKRDAMDALQVIMESERQTAAEMKASQAMLDQQLAHAIDCEASLHKQMGDLESQRLALEQKLREQSAHCTRLREFQTAAGMRCPPHWTSDPKSGGLKMVRVSRGQRDWNALGRCLAVEVPAYLGDGRDQADKRDRPYNRLELVSAWRVEHPNLWHKYVAEVNKMRGDLQQHRATAPPEASRGPLARARELLPDETSSDINETFLVHGTKPEFVPGIMESGFNERFVGRGFFGYGIYLADDAGKADQYIVKDSDFNASEKLHPLLYSSPEDRERNRGVYYIIVCRVALGFAAHSFDGQVVAGSSDAAFSSSKNPGGKSMRRELAEIPQAGGMLYHSLIIEKTMEEEFARLPAQDKQMRVKRYREYVMTHGERIYPQYLLAVRRRRA